MKACAIIAEYNPFHNGHAWHVKETRQCTHADVIVAVMSGNFVQRGELAIVDKWKRAEVALKHGVDIVIELPTLSAVQSADYFAHFAIKHVKALQCDFLSFGVEQQNTELLQTIATTLQNMQHSNNYTLSYYDRITAYVAQHLGKEAAKFVETPNNQLALAYVKAIQNQNLTIECVPILRRGANHTDTDFSHDCIASGSAIRQAVQQQIAIENYVSEDMVYYLVHHSHIKTEWWQILKILLLTKTHEELRHIYQVDEGIEHRLKQSALHACSYEDFLNQAMTKRFKKARIKRICIYIMLNITKIMMQEYRERPTEELRVLGFTSQGLRYLKTLQHVEWITQFKHHHFSNWGTQIQYDNVYNALCQQGDEQSFRRVLRL
ncbi:MULTISPECIES: nucleotidyltransferase [unclassified Granulicatella]|uniref:nucleotidyltransferase n=1 Tax=unclassified Granulicatella TaxID=2630493 RepID=UPI0010749308|nr:MULTISPECIES: nucleotidyltransferase [unclassified Granulicatella]MBF0780818.1 nucleotidyltransferase [Granulicatella sp. 19428wC4_WM01]TFU93804.1 nucleotidyltransferase [Granulicatella sp. WM01]